jgi:hypothetical protein
VRLRSPRPSRRRRGGLGLGGDLYPSIYRSFVPADLPTLPRYLPIYTACACGLGSRRVKGEYTKLRLIDASLLLPMLNLVCVMTTTI